jgi:hypothetical protein
MPTYIAWMFLMNRPFFKTNNQARSKYKVSTPSEYLTTGVEQSIAKINIKKYFTRQRSTIVSLAEFQALPIKNTYFTAMMELGRNSFFNSWCLENSQNFQGCTYLRLMKNL